MTQGAAIEGNDPREIVFVHGRDFKPPADELLDICIAATAAGIERDSPELLHAFHAAGKRLAWYADCTNRYLESTGRHYDAALDVGDRRNALRELRTLVKRKHFSVSRYDRLPGKTSVHEFAAGLVAPLLGSIGLADALIGKVARDFIQYWNPESDFGPLVRERVRAAIVAAMENDKKIMLVSHGTGSIVAYDVLWQLSHHPDFAGQYAHYKIDQWLTLGSPLGDEMVKRRIFGAKNKGKGRYPTNILCWHNIAAEDDYLCHDNTVENDYRPMLQQRLVSSIRDYRIYNLAVRYGKSNPHSSLGYLIHPRVSKIIGDWLRQADAGDVPMSIF